MPNTSLNRQRCTQRRHRLPVAAIGLILLAVVGPVAAAPVNPTQSPYSFNASVALRQASTTWLNPCGLNALKPAQPSGKIDKLQKYQDMESGINHMLNELSYWRNLQGRKTDMDWNSHERKIKFKFLKPFARNDSNWERRLSIYWASLKLVLMFHNNHSDSTTLVPKELNALESVNIANQELLCVVQEYRPVTKRNKKQIDARRMEDLIKFNIKDASEIEIDIWYITCRLECFLTNMRKHLKRLRANSDQQLEVGNMMKCDQCPYCGKRTKNCKTGGKKKKQQQQQQQQQQQHSQSQRKQQQRQHNRPAGHSNRPKPTKQQTSKQPKQGRKNTRTPKSHARSSHG